MAKIEIKKKGKKGESAKNFSQNGPQVSDIKINTNHSNVRQKQIHSRVIEIKEEKEIAKKPVRHKRKKIFAFSLTALGVAVVIFLAFFSLNYLFSHDGLAKYVPADAKLYVHANTKVLLNPNNDLHFLAAKFIKPDVWQKEIEKNMTSTVFASYGLDFDRDVKPVLSDEIGLLFLEGSTKNSFAPVIVIKAKKSFQLQSFLGNIKNVKSIKERNLTVTKIKNIVFEKTNSNFSAAQIGDIIFLSREPEVIEKCAFAKQKKSNFSSQANKITNAFYFDKGKIAQIYTTTKTVDVLKDFLKNNLTKNLLANLGKTRVSFVAKRDGIKMYFDGESSAKNSKKTSLKVATFLPKKAVFSFWANDLNAEFNANRESSYLADFSKEVTQYGISAEELFAGFSGEFGFAFLPKKDNKATYVFVSEIREQEKFNKSKEDLEKSIVTYFSKTNPKEKTFKLADGTEATELVPNKDAIKFTEKDIEGIKVKSFKDEKTSTRVNLAQAGEIFMLTIGPMKFNEIFIGESFSVTDNFKELYKKISGQRKSEMLYLDTKNILDFFGKSQTSQTFWQPAKNLMIGLKNGKGEGYLLTEN